MVIVWRRVAVLHVGQRYSVWGWLCRQKTFFLSPLRATLYPVVPHSLAHAVLRSRQRHSLMLSIAVRHAKGVADQATAHQPAYLLAC